MSCNRPGSAIAWEKETNQALAAQESLKKIMATLSLHTHIHHGAELTERKNKSTLKDRRNWYKMIATLSQLMSSSLERVPNQ